MSEAHTDPTAHLLQSIGTFAELVAEGTATPGGGSVSAYCGVLASSLGQMVCSITIGKPKYASVETRLKEIRQQLEWLGSRLRELIAEDAAAFDDVLRAYRLPKETDEQKAARADEIQKALQHAVDVPLDTAERATAALALLDELSEIGSPNALSDVAVAAQLAATAVRGASYNVLINLDSLADRGRAVETREQIEALVAGASANAKRVDAKMKH